MDRQQATETVRGYLGNYLSNKGLPLNRKFRCLNPEHNDIHPSMSFNKKCNNVHCFSCNATYSIFDLIGMDYGISEIADIFAKAYELYNIQIDKPEVRSNMPRIGEKKDTPIESKKSEVSTEEDKLDFLEYYSECRKHLKDNDAQTYLMLRGIGQNIADRFNIGYDVAKKRLIIPVTSGFYIARDITGKAHRYDNPAGVPVELFNEKALYNEDARPVFITEGTINALSIIEAGGIALSLNGAGNWRKVTEKIKNKRTRSVLVLCLDNDDAGIKTAADLAEALQEINIPYIMANIFGSANDANEALTTDRQAFIEAVTNTEKEAKYMRFPGIFKPARIKATLEAVDDHYIELPSFPLLARKLKLHTHDTVVIASDTGAGKSSLSLNFLHDLQDKYPALYFNLEMEEATVFQRLIAIHSGLELNRIEGYKHDANTRTEVNKAIDEISARKEIHFVSDLYDLKQIKEYIQDATESRKEPTMVFIDTGLLVTLPNKSASRYDRFTQISEELRRISRLNNIIMFVLLQQNREGKKEEQKTPANSSLKESGSWENDATKILFLWNNPQTDRKEIVITKNRSGEGGSVVLDYSPQTQTYKEYNNNRFYKTTDIDEKRWKDATII